jgi:prevent-host-death family protein
MAETGIRELRDHLSQYLDRVRAGEELTVTDRGRAVARLVPLSGPRAFDRLVAEGIIERAESGVRHRPTERVAVAGGVIDLVAEQRR